MSDTSAPAAGDSTARDEGIPSVAAAMAELERRDKERAAQRKAAKAKADESDGEDEGEAEGRRPPKRPGEKDESEEVKPKKAKAEKEDDDADESDDEDDDRDDDESEDDRDEPDDEDDDRDDDEEPPKKAKDEAPQKMKLRFEGRDVEASSEHVQEYIDHTARAAQEVKGQQQQIQQARQYIQQQAAALAQLSHHLLGTEPALELAQSDPQTYLVQKGLFQQRQQVFQQLLQHAQSAAGQAHDQEQQNTQQRKAAGQQALLKAMPELADPQKLAAFSGRAMKVAQDYGYAPRDLDSMLHPGFYVMLRDLGRLRDMEAGREGIKKKLAGAPPLKTPEQRASASPRDAKGLRAKDAKRAFMKSDRSMRSVREYLDRTSR